jgi:arsenate reductase
MNAPVYEVLFVCTHDSARSIVAAAILGAAGRGRFRAHSAGSHPAGRVHPLAIEAPASMRLPTAGDRSEDGSEFAKPGAPVLDFVFRVCDNAAGEVRPVGPGQPMTAHWGVEDPAAFVGDEADARKVFRDVGTVLERRTDLMLAPLLPSLDRPTLQRELRQIGTR